MPTLNINGRRVQVDDSFLSLTPEQQNATVDEIASQLGEVPQAESAQSQDLRSDLSSMSTKLGDASIDSLAQVRYDQMPEWKKPIVAAGDLVDLAANGMTMGFGDKAAAAARAAFTDKSYDEELAAMRQATQGARDRAGYAGTAAEFGGLIATPVALANRGATLAGRFGTGAMEGAKGIAARAGLMGAEGAAYGGLSAAGNDADIAEGALLGGGLGAAVPVVAGVGRAVAKPFMDAVRARTNPGAYAVEKVAERVTSRMPVDQAGRRMAAGEGLNLADVGGESARGLLRTATNIPGKARDRVQAQLTLRQFGQGDRLKAAISRTFADPNGYMAAKDAIADAAEKAAGPLYRRAYARPTHFSKTLEGILETPAGKSALRHAEQLAGNEQVPFKQMFVNITQNGQVVRRVPDTRGWDYIKRAMDDMIARETDSITKKVTNEGRILVGLKNRMLAEVDQLNPDYAAARSAWAGKAALDDALETGREVFRMSPEALKRAVADMGPAQKASARIGAAETLRNQIEQAGVTNNAILRIFSRPAQMRNLQTLFESPEKFREFRSTIISEARKRATYQAVTGNSTTVRQAIDMAEAGGLQEGVDTARNLITTGPVNATLQFIGSRLRMLGGMTPTVADEVSKRLMAGSAKSKAAVINELQRINQLKISAEQKRQAVQAFVARALAIAAPAGIAAE
ncbi:MULTISPECIES: hypothetical protein [unclassified Shinella]|uniref:hypothetical protein n=1 Tax=unclassified Shinella TaxID=2643062 RepID=UPI00225D0CC0|nr:MULTISPECIES: hypothetical protein [unclassified Shinella]MCO5140885.1 hypothetical protein [Shinella sp.]MDC7256424.1 hypothetical protein [Shinella sp. YE25]CAI0339290.1 conserved hypothetical protein [Rhizobiaceae bacterium]CAK7257700.1 conserved protein of unknown function [Shinella sp. WSC3-e]